MNKSAARRITAIDLFCGVGASRMASGGPA